VNKKNISEKIKKVVLHKNFWPIFGFSIVLLVIIFSSATFIFSDGVVYRFGEKQAREEDAKKVAEDKIKPLDKADYDLRIEKLANNPVVPPPEPKYDPKTGELIPSPVVTPKPTLWPVKTVYPKDGAILPFNRIIAYYGNLYSTKMGVLGEYKEDIMLEKLKAEVDKWTAADPETPAIPALHYIAVVAQGSAGADGKYRARMPDKEIDKVIAMAEKINALVFLDIQVALSNVQAEIPYFEKYLKLPNVHLGIDPEFSMKTGKKPGTVIGTFDASDINFATDYLAKLVKENNLTPKILIVHRFTQGMITNYKNIKIVPEVQTVIDMDGWGPKAKKLGTYKYFVAKEPVQFTGFKLFYKNDVKESGATLLSPEELLKLTPRPIYIQYQ
jgi:hypothetical protein